MNGWRGGRGRKHPTSNIEHPTSNENRSNENGLRPSLVPRRLRKEGEGKRGEDAPPGISDVSYSLSAFVALDDDVAHSALGPDAEEDRTFGLPHRLTCYPA